MVRDICSSLHIDPSQGVLLQPWRRPNLRLRVELVGGESYKRQRLLEILSAYVPRFKLTRLMVNPSMHHVHMPTPRPSIAERALSQSTRD